MEGQEAFKNEAGASNVMPEVLVSASAHVLQPPVFPQQQNLSGPYYFGAGSPMMIPMDMGHLQNMQVSSVRDCLTAHKCDEK